MFIIKILLSMEALILAAKEDRAGTSWNCPEIRDYVSSSSK